jgi:hypothetical protein
MVLGLPFSAENLRPSFIEEKSRCRQEGQEHQRIEQLRHTVFVKPLYQFSWEFLPGNRWKYDGAASDLQREVRTKASRHHNRHLARGYAWRCPTRAMLGFVGLSRPQARDNQHAGHSDRLLPKIRTECGVTRFRQFSQQKLGRCVEIGVFPDSQRSRRGMRALWS